MNLDPRIFGDDAPKQNLCSVEGCDRPRRRRGRLCSAHQKRKQRGQSLETPLRTTLPKSARPCSVAVCRRHVHAKGFCYQHYRRNKEGLELSTQIAARFPGGGSAHLAGFAIHKETKAALRARAKDCGLSIAALSGRLLDAWAKQFLEDRRSSESRVLSEDSKW